MPAAMNESRSQFCTAELTQGRAKVGVFRVVCAPHMGGGDSDDFLICGAVNQLQMAVLEERRRITGSAVLEERRRITGSAAGEENGAFERLEGAAAAERVPELELVEDHEAGGDDGAFREGHHGVERSLRRDVGLQILHHLSAARERVFFKVLEEVVVRGRDRADPWLKAEVVHISQRESQRIFLQRGIFHRTKPG